MTAISVSPIFWRSAAIQWKILFFPVFWVHLTGMIYSKKCWLCFITMSPLLPPVPDPADIQKRKYLTWSPVRSAVRSVSFTNGQGIILILHQKSLQGFWRRFSCLACCLFYPECPAYKQHSKTRLSNSLKRVFIMPVAHRSGHPVSWFSLSCCV